jgi:triphosphoribosyl-dephospho-CoA synthase
MSGRPAVPHSASAIRPQAAGGSWPGELAALAVSALLDAAGVTPTLALLDRGGRGAHDPLDLTRMRGSLMALKDGFTALAEASAAAARPSEGLREELGRIGREIERRMPTAVDGSTAHRGRSGFSDCWWPRPRVGARITALSASRPERRR